MKILVNIVNFGDSQLNYLQQVIDEIKSFKKYKSTIIVNTNVPVNINGIDKVNLFNLDNCDPNLLPLTCRSTILEESNKDYDLFIFNENDHLLKEIHLDKFIEYSKILPPNRISGLMQFELDPNGKLHFPAYHANFNWDHNSIEEYGGKKFAYFTNVHQACFILNKSQLQNIISNFDFSQPIGNSFYGIKERVNTDIYENCNLKKLICISEFKENLIHHLPNLYSGGLLGRAKLGSGEDQMNQVLTTLLNK